MDGEQLVATCTPAYGMRCDPSETMEVTLIHYDRSEDAACLPALRLFNKASTCDSSEDNYRPPPEPVFIQQDDEWGDNSTTPSDSN
jgi:hypothetical protein